MTRIDPKLVETHCPGARVFERESARGIERTLYWRVQRGVPFVGFAGVDALVDSLPAGTLTRFQPEGGTLADWIERFSSWPGIAKFPALDIGHTDVKNLPLLAAAPSLAGLLELGTFDVKASTPKKIWKGPFPPLRHLALHCGGPPWGSGVPKSKRATSRLLADLAAGPLGKTLESLSLEGFGDVCSQYDEWPEALSGLRCLTLHACEVAYDLPRLLARFAAGRLAQLDLHMCTQADGHGWEACPDVPSLRWLGLPGNYISGKGIAALVELPFFGRLLRLDLKSNGDALADLSQAEERLQHSSLAVLDVGFATDASLLAFARSKALPSLSVLGIGESHAKVTDEGVRAALEARPKLTIARALDGVYDAPLASD